VRPRVHSIRPTLRRILKKSGINSPLSVSNLKTNVKKIRKSLPKMKKSLMDIMRFCIETKEMKRN